MTHKTLAASIAWQTKGTITSNSEMGRTCWASHRFSNGGLFNARVMGWEG